MWRSACWKRSTVRRCAAASVARARPGRDDRRDMCGTPRPGLSALRSAQPSVPRRLSHRVPESGTSGSLSEVARTRFVLPRCGRGTEQGAAAPGVRDGRRSPHCPPCPLRVPGGCVRRGWKLLLVAGAGGTVAAAPKFAPKVQCGDWRGALRPPGPQPHDGAPTFRAGSVRSCPESRTGKSLRREGPGRAAGSFRTR